MASRIFSSSSSKPTDRLDIGGGVAESRRCTGQKLAPDLVEKPGSLKPWSSAAGVGEKMVWRERRVPMKSTMQVSTTNDTTNDRPWNLGSGIVTSWAADVRELEGASGQGNEGFLEVYESVASSQPGPAHLNGCAGLIQQQRSKCKCRLQIADAHADGR